MLVISLQHQFYLLTTIYKASFTCAQLQKCHKAGVSARMNSIWQTRLKQLAQKLLLEVSADQVQQIVLSLDNLQQLVISYGIVKCFVALLLNSTYCSFYSLYPFIRLLLQYQFLIQYGISICPQTSSFDTGKQVENCSDMYSKNHCLIYISSQVQVFIKFIVFKFLRSYLPLYLS
ncbi:Hypothetical_protein [Hexamita inflata]|uniref:Hypothetical_protein n=1 Tax=Hexamita inflata TaxID=28002 RepID=A0AA86QAE9_9EUKA|nr:Hypothetical protein HINF_LOCUS41021 [Hexamita inflata]